MTAPFDKNLEPMPVVIVVQASQLERKPFRRVHSLPNCRVFTASRLELRFLSCVHLTRHSFFFSALFLTLQTQITVTYLFC